MDLRTRGSRLQTSHCSSNQGTLFTIRTDIGRPDTLSALHQDTAGAKLNLKQRAKRSVISKTTTSKMGKRAVKKMAPKEMIELINALKTLVEKETGSSRKAHTIENNILRVGVKIYFLVTEGKVPPAQVALLFLHLHRPWMHFDR